MCNESAILGDPDPYLPIHRINDTGFLKHYNIFLINHGRFMDYFF